MRGWIVGEPASRCVCLRRPWVGRGPVRWGIGGRLRRWRPLLGGRVAAWAGVGAGAFRGVPRVFLRAYGVGGVRAAAPAPALRPGPPLAFRPVVGPLRGASPGASAFRPVVGPLRGASPRPAPSRNRALPGPGRAGASWLAAQFPAPLEGGLRPALPLLAPPARLSGRAAHPITPPAHLGGGAAPRGRDGRARGRPPAEPHHSLPSHLRPASPLEGPHDLRPASPPEGPHTSAQPPAGPPAPDLAALADQVLHLIERRALAQRERLGRG
jgi:hypothetical protein